MSGKLLAAAGIGFSQSYQARAASMGRALFYVAILLIFSRLWHVVQEQGALASLHARDLLWYIALTEWVVLSVPHLHLDLEREIRTGDYAYSHIRPVAPLPLRLAFAAGDLLFRLAFLLPVGFCAAWIFAGGLPSHPAGLLLALPLGALAAFLATLFLAAIGLSALWVLDVSPLYFVWQKLVFVLGGLLLPLQIYPRWLAVAAHYTPFQPMLNGVGSQVFGRGGAGGTLLALAAWTGVALLLLWRLARAGLSRLDATGG